MHDLRTRDDKDVLDARTSARLSARLRQARQMRCMTLKVLADGAGCSESLLSKIENGKAYPSLPMLSRLVKTLDIGMGWMFDDHDGEEPIIFRAAQRTAAPAERAVTVERVIPDSDRHALRCNILHVEAGATSEGEHQHTGEEVGYLVDGQLELLISGRSHRLSAGDAFAFRSDQPHGWRNVGPTRASVFWVNTPSGI
ncbi:cupin domain-containing protein [Lichenibacterium dinghuense]|uniref:cupin domain-containing protein n=1 Tax=Lichenibacterium dinghuense TaxID=2895977 RepID=UPI001F157C16|nr:cupin domain-containing protein [Lichenibacterium sp. 6Y81]